jgi:uncharacterized protein DUF5333
VLLHNARGRGRGGFSRSQEKAMTRSNPGTRTATAALVAAALASGGVSASAQDDSRPPLREVAQIDNELYYIAIASEIDKVCDDINGRRLKAISVMWGLRSQANKLGYSDDEIRSYVESKSEQDRMRKKGEAYLAARGVSYDQPETFCALGRAEIARNSAIGVYLRAK